MKKAELAILNAALDEAKARAKAHPQEAVNLVIEELNRAGDNMAKVKVIMDGASARGFQCEFWPNGGFMSIRVRWEG